MIRTRSTVTARTLAESAGQSPSAHRPLGLARFLFPLLGLSAALSMAPAVVAQPQGGHVVAGSANIQQHGANTTITAANNTIINFQRFNIPVGTSVRFIQPTATSRVLNRITGPDPSVIAGRLSSNGIVYIANPAGVFFANGALVNVGGICAAAGKISNADFLTGVNRFTGMSGTVENRGSIQASGPVSLLGAHAANYGTIVAPHGAVTLAAGSEVYVSDRDQRVLARFAPAPPSAQGSAEAGVTNAGTIEARKVVLGSGDLYAMAIDQRGLIKAQQVSLRGGQGGVVSVSGTIDASSAAGEGGKVEVLGDKVGIFGGTVDASGATGGGEVLIGGNMQGKGPQPNASAVYVSHDATVRADATASGNGGTIIVWSDVSTRVYGELSAKGGALAGNGGFIETSGGTLDLRGVPDVTASRGQGGTWLIDPHDITIDTYANSNGFPSPNPTNPFEPDSDNARLDIDDLMAAFTGGANIIVRTTAGGSDQGNIKLNTDIDFNGTGTNSLTFEAHNNIIIDGQIHDSVAGGDVLNLTLTANSDATGGGKVQINQPISLGGGSFTASGASAEVGANITAGPIVFNAPVVLTADTVLAGTAITFNSTLDTDGTAWNLDLNTSASGVTTFAGQVGNTDALGALTTNADGSTVINTGVVKSDVLDFKDDVVVATTSVLTATTSATFEQRVDSEASEANSLTVNSPLTGFLGQVGNQGAGTELGTLTTDATGTTTINTDQVKAAALDFKDDVVLAVSATLTTTGGTTFEKKLDSETDEANDLTVSGALTFGGAVGSSVAGATTHGALGTLTANDAATISGGSIKGDILDFQGAVTVTTSALTTLTGATSVNFASTLDGEANLGRSLTINSPDTTFGADVGFAGANTGFGTFTTDASGTTTINASRMKAATFALNDPVVIGVNTTLAASGSVTLAQVDSAAGLARNLIINAPTTTFNGQVGNAAGGALGTLTTNSAGTTTINTAVVKGAVLDFQDSVVLGTTATLTGTTSIGFGGTLDSEASEANSLTLNGTVSFNGAVGAAANGALGTLTANNAATIAGGSMKAAVLDFAGAVTVTTSASTTLTGTTSVTFQSTLDGEANLGRSLTINSPLTTFGDEVGFIGANTGFGTLATDAPGTTHIDTNLVKAANINFADAAVVGVNNTILVGTTSVTLAQIDSAALQAFNLTINSPATTFNGQVGNAPNGAFGTLLTNSAGTTTINTSVMKAATLNFQDSVVLGVTSALTATTGITFGGTLDSQADEANSLTLNGAVAFDNTVGASTTGATTLGALGTLTVNSPLTIAGGSIRGAVLNFVNTVTLATSSLTTLTGTTSVTFQSTLDSEAAQARSLTINSPTTTFGAQVGLLAADTALGTLTTDAAGTTTINTTDARAAVLAFGDRVIIGLDNTTLTGTTSASFAALDSAATLARTLTIVSPSTTFNGAVGNTANSAFGTLTTDAAGTTTVNTSVVKAATLDFKDNVLLDAASTFTATVGTTFEQKLDSVADEANSLTLNGAVTFQGAVGSNATGSTTLGALGTLTANNAATLAGGSMKAATLDFVGAATLTTNALTTLTGTTLVRFQSTLDSEAALARSLTINAPTTTFGGVVGNALGALGTLTTDAAGTTNINTTAVSGATLAFGDHVVLGANATLTGTTSATFAAIDGAGRNLTVNSPDTTFGGAIGGGGALGTLTTDAAGTTTISTASVSAATMLFNDAVELGADTTLSGTTAHFFSTVDSTGAAHDLTVNATTTLFDQAVGGILALDTLTTDAAGTTTVAAPTMGAATFSFGDNFLFGADLTLTGTTATFAATKTVNWTGAAHSLTVNATTTQFNGAVGNLGNLTLLRTDAAGTTTLGANVSATVVDILDDATISGAVTVTGPTSVNFAQTVNGGTGALTVNSPLTTFGGTVGNSAPLASLTTDAAGTTHIAGGQLAASGAVNLQDDVRIGANTTVSGGSVTFAKTVASETATARALTVNSSGATLFGGAIGSPNVLASLTTDAAGTTRLNGATLQVSGLVNLQDNVLIDAAGGLTITAGTTVRFGGTLNSATSTHRALTVNAAGATTFAADVGNLEPLASVSVTPGAIVLGGPTFEVDTSAQFGGPVTLTGDVDLLAGTSIIFGSTVNGGFALSAQGGTVQFNGQVGAGTALDSLTVGGTATIATDVVRAGSVQFLDGVLLQSNTTVTATTGDAEFFSTIDNSGFPARTLTVNSSGLTSFMGEIGGTAPLAGLTTDAPGSTFLAGDINVTTTVFNDTVSLGSNILITGPGLSSIRFANDLDGAGFDLSLGTRTVTFAGNASGLGLLDTSALALNTATTIQGPGSISGTTLHFGSGLLTLNVDAVLTGTSSVVFDGTIVSQAAGAHALVINSPDTTFNAGFGTGASRLGVLTTDAAGTTTINTGATVEAGTINFQDALNLATSATITGGTVTFGGAVSGSASSLTVNAANITIAGGSVDTGTGDQAYSGSVLLTADTTFGGHNVAFGGTVNGPALALTVNTTGGGLTTFGAAVGGVGSLAGLVTNADGTTALGGDVSAGSVDLGDAVRLDASLTLTAGTVRFHSTLDSAAGQGSSLAINAVDTRLDGDVGAASGGQLGSLTTSAGGTTRLSASQVNALTINFLDTLALDASTTLNGASVTLGGAVSSGPALSSLTVNAASITLSGGSVSTGGDQAYNGAVQLGAASFFTGPNISFNGTLDSMGGARDLTVSLTGGGALTFAGTTGGTARLGTLTVNGLTRVGAQVNTTGTALFNGAVRVFADAGVDSSGGDLRFTSPIDNEGGTAHALALSVGAVAADAKTIPVIFFGGSLGAGGQLGLVTLGGDRAAGDIPLLSTIAFDTGSANPAADVFTIRATGLRMGQNQKLTVLGSLTVDVGGGTATVGDMSVLGDLAITAGTLNFLDRVGATVYGPPRTGINELVGPSTFGDTGVDLVARKITLNAGAIHQGAHRPSLATAHVIDITGGGSLLQRIFDGDIDAKSLRSTALDGSVRYFDLRTDGPTTTNVSESIAGAIPHESHTGQVVTGTSVSAADAGKLTNLGIFPRKVEQAELVDFLSGRGFYVDPHNDPRSGPGKRKRELAADDYTVAVGRLPSEIVTMVLRTYESIYVQQDAGYLSNSIGAAWAAYTAAEGAQADPRGLARFAEGSPEHAEAAKALHDLGDLWSQLGYLGLTPPQLEIARATALGPIAPEGVPMKEAVQGAAEGVSTQQ